MMEILASLLQKISHGRLYVITNKELNCMTSLTENLPRTFIRNAILVNEGKTFKGGLVIEGENIAEIVSANELPSSPCQYEIDAEGMLLIPGVIDAHVHFRDPGLTHKADTSTESRAAAAGGVTSYMDMPNTNPQTTSLETLEAKFIHAAEESSVNYSYFFGATNDNTSLLHLLDKRYVCGVKLFMGSSTGNMLVDDAEALRHIFKDSPLPIMAHCEDQHIIQVNTNKFTEELGKEPDVTYHPLIRSVEACYESTRLAVELAKETGVRLHVAHVSTARELELFSSSVMSDNKRITAEACVAHLYFSDKDYPLLGTRIKCNPSIKSITDRDALRKALSDGRIDIIGTDHAPHLLSEKKGGALTAVSGMPMVQFSLVTMLEMVDEGVLDLPLLVEKMCHAPARLFNIKNRGYLRSGYKADLVLVRPDSPWTVCSDNIHSKCGWSPMEGHTYCWKVERTFVNGQTVYVDGVVNEQIRGQRLEFDR